MIAIVTHLFHANSAPRSPANEARYPISFASKEPGIDLAGRLSVRKRTDSAAIAALSFADLHCIQCVACGLRESAGCNSSTIPTPDNF